MMAASGASPPQPLRLHQLQVVVLTGFLPYIIAESAVQEQIELAVVIRAFAFGCLEHCQEFFFIVSGVDLRTDFNKTPIFFGRYYDIKIIAANLSVDVTITIGCGNIRDDYWQSLGVWFQ